MTLEALNAVEVGGEVEAPQVRMTVQISRIDAAPWLRLMRDFLNQTPPDPSIRRCPGRRLNNDPLLNGNGPLLLFLSRREQPSCPPLLSATKTYTSHDENGQEDQKLERMTLTAKYEPTWKKLATIAQNNQIGRKNCQNHKDGPI